MSLSKAQVSSLIRKRRKATLFNTIEFLQLQQVEEDTYFNDPRNRRVIDLFVLTRSWPHHQYNHMRPKDVPAWVYRSWFTHFLRTGASVNHVWDWEPRDHDWMLMQLLE